ncbi:MAG: hypothetical protein C0412_20970, partial [Flavobacterium sp.]|nr:hypothetical protein [Flavobacterium sp.]
MFEEDEGKTEFPTPKRLGETWDKGNFAKAPEIALVAVLAATFVVLLFKAKERATLLSFWALDIFSHLGQKPVSLENVVRMFHEDAVMLFSTLSPLFFSCVGLVIVSIGLQTGFRVSTQMLEMDINKLNPVDGFKRLFNFKSNLVALGIDSLKFVAVGFVIYGALKKIQYHPIFYTPIPVQYLGLF